MRSASSRIAGLARRCAAATFLSSFVLGASTTISVAQSATSPAAALIHPNIWPKLQSGVPDDPAIDARVTDILSKMTLEEKVGQIIQGDITTLTPADIRTYHLGSVLDGGSSGPYGNDRAPAADWLKEADEFWHAAMDNPAPGHVPIPIIWGSDSVHGNSNIIGATIFPHNIGLGAMRDPALVRKIGEITAIETAVVGQDWTFSPTIAVARDDRWGRTYESYSENSDVVRAYAGEMVKGIQGEPGMPGFLRNGHILATAKHYLGDGGTANGKDQGDTTANEEELRDIHSAGYQSAIEAGVQTVMVSFSSWRGQHMSGNRTLLEDVLRGRFGFNGFTVSDWNAHGQLPGCSNTNCPTALLAGVDMYMAPDSWKGLYQNTLAEVKSGRIRMARLDEAVARILRVKLRAGVFEAGPPSQRPFGGKWEQLSSPEHRAVARQSVRESLVLLKNDNQLLPLKPRLNVLVGGDGADNMSKQTGGWTISWQGTGNSRADFPRAQTIYEGIAEQVKAAGGNAVLSADGHFGAKPDVAIVVFGEDPYAEFMGDRRNVAFEPGDPRDLQLVRSLKAQGVPVVAVFLSGRPLYVTREINAADAFVAAWLPGSEGGGVADLLFRKADDSIQYDFRGKLSFSWPRGPNQTPLNIGDPNYNPLFPFGYGLDYAHPQDIGQLPEAAEGELVAANDDQYLLRGHAAPPWRLVAMANRKTFAADSFPTTFADGGLSLSRADHLAQEDTLVARWNGGALAGLGVSGAAVDLSRQASGDMALKFDLRVDTAPTAPVLLTACGKKCAAWSDISALLRSAAPLGWTTISVPLSCLKKAGLDMTTVTAPFMIGTGGQLGLSLTGVRLATTTETPSCPPPPPEVRRLSSSQRV